MRKQLCTCVIIISLSIILTACGGGVGSNENFNPTNKYPAAKLNVTFEAYNKQYSGINESGIKIINATPFNQRTIIVARITNTLNYPIFNVGAFPIGGRGNRNWDTDYTTRPLNGNETPYNINYAESGMGYIQYNSLADSDVRLQKIVGSDWCGYTFTQKYIQESALQPGQSCVIYNSIDWAMNYDNTEYIDLPFGYGFSAKNPDFPAKSEYGVRYDSNWPDQYICPPTATQCLPILYAPIKIGRWYVGEQGYNFPNISVGLVASNTEIDGDYLYLNSAQKIKVNYDINGVAQLDFNNNLTNCIGSYCYLYGGNISYGIAVDHTKGLNTSNYYYKNYWPSGISYPATQVYRFNYSPMPINELIPNISEVRAIQPDGTLIGANSAGIYGCFNNDGSNFRPFGQLYGWKVGHLSGTSWNVTYDQSNWIPVRSTNEQQFWKVVADNTGKCQLDPVNSFTFDEIMYSQAGYLGLNMMQPQITKSGVFAQNVIGGKQYLKFYKYPPAQN